MSGPICQSCGCPYLRSAPKDTTGNMAECEFCGWIGDVSNLPRKMLTPDSYSNWQQRMREKRAGRLFIIKVWYNEKDNDFAASEIMELLGVTSASHKKDAAGEFLQMEVSTRPTKETAEKLNKINGVESVIIF